MKILALDASSKSTGVAFFEDGKLIKSINVVGVGKPFERIEQMTNQVLDLAKEFRPTDIVMEDILPADVGNNFRTFRTLHYLQASFVLNLFKTFPSIEVVLYTASHWRKIVSIKNGRGVKREELKKQSVKLVKDIYKVDVNDDVSDAICIGMAYFLENRSAWN